jgi:vitamin B12 transporter
MFVDTRGGKMRLIFFSLLLGSVFPLIANSDSPKTNKATLEPIVFSSKKKISLEKITTTTEVIESENLQQLNQARIIEALDNIVGVDIAQNGLVGGVGSVFIRGGEGRHTLILIDGVKVYDPSSIDRSFNLSQLNLNDIERIEVLKGPQSVLYGADAMAGVINIITNKASTKDSVSLGTGYYDELKTQNTFFIHSGILSLATSFQKSEYASIAEAEEEKDSLEAKNLTLNYSQPIGELFEFDFLFKLNDSYSQADGYDFDLNEVVDDKFAYGRMNHVLTKLHLKQNWSYESTMNYQLNLQKFNRENKYFSDNSYKTNHYLGEIKEADFYNELRQVDGKLIVGTSLLTESFQTDDITEKNMSIMEAYFHRTFESDSLDSVFEYGVRVSHSIDYGDHLVTHMGWNKSFFQHHGLKLSYATGYKPPSLYQLRAPENNFGAVGNEYLAPEKLQAIDLNYNYKLQKFKFYINLFYNEYEDLIEYDQGYKNISQAIFQGTEFGIEQSVNDIKYGIGTSMIHSQLSSGKEATKRPNFTVNSFLLYSLKDFHSLRGDWKWQGRRFERINGVTKRLEPYDVFDISYQFKKEDVAFSAGVKNIFDRDYEYSKGYAVLRRALEAKIRFIY